MLNFKTHFRLLAASVLLFSFSSAHSLTVCAVGCDEVTIADGIAAASAGDVLNLQDANYNESGLVIDKNLTIVGKWGKSTIDAGGVDRLFEVVAPATQVTFRRLKLINGYRDQTVSGVFGHYNSGGAIVIRNGNVTINNSLLSNNTSGDNGGAIALRNDTSLITSFTTFDSNNAEDDGGAINCYFCESVEISYTLLKNNSVPGDGGAISSHLGGSISLDRSRLVDNSSDRGGAIEVYDTNLTINNSTFTRNHSFHSGGAVNMSLPSVLKIDNSTFNNNTADYRGAAIALNEIGYDGKLGASIKNSTFSRNTSADSGSAISEFLSKVVIEYSTFYKNKSTTTSPKASANTILNGDFEMHNSIIVSDPVTPPCFNMLGTASTGNLIDDPTESCMISPTAPTNISASLSLNGAGLFGTRTHKLLSNSNAIDMGVSGCTFSDGQVITIDQRNKPRPAGVNCDVGAYEVQ